MPYTAKNPRRKIQRATPPPLDHRALAWAAAEARRIERFLRRHGMPPVHLGRKPTIERPLPPRTPKVITRRISPRQDADAA